jgi:alpha-amylase/alpha-mannosidase (GH57 family)
MTSVFHLLGFHMHQPPGNLRLLIDSNEWEARQIMLCYERPLTYAARYPECQFGVGFSGILLEQFEDPYIVSRYAGIVDIPAMLARYRETPNIEIVGMGYYHPIFPLIPIEDWDEQIARGKRKAAALLGREPKIFWPPEMAFSMEMVPALARHGYEYVVIDSVHVQPRQPMQPGEAVYRLHRAEYGGASITVIPRDRDLSNAQESGLNPDWFLAEVGRKTAGASKPCLVTTWTDGENGGWFRQIDESSGFWGYFFAPYVEKARSGQSPVQLTSVHDFARAHPPTTLVDVRTGAWNVGSTSGYDFAQWAGSGSQKQALEEIYQVRRRYEELRRARVAAPQLQEAYEAILRAETSCYLFWGDAWIPKLYAEAQTARDLMKQI